jgi:hypothetical protein
MEMGSEVLSSREIARILGTSHRKIRRNLGERATRSEVERLITDPPAWVIEGRKAFTEKRGKRKPKRRNGPGPGLDDLGLLVDALKDGIEADWHPKAGVFEIVHDTKDRMWITKPILRARGWTDAGIRDFLPAPEGYKKNPHYSSAGAPMPVWSPETVAGAEAGKEWQAWLEKSLTRRKTTLAALAYPPDADERFIAKLEAVQAAIDKARG